MLKRWQLTVISKVLRGAATRTSTNQEKVNIRETKEMIERCLICIRVDCISVIEKNTSV